MIYAITDIETTGGQPSGNSIVEIGVVLWDGQKVIDEFHSLIDPGVSIPLFITRLTGITDEMIAGAPNFEIICLCSTQCQLRLFIHKSGVCRVGDKLERTAIVYSAPCSQSLSGKKVVWIGCYLQLDGFAQRASTPRTQRCEGRHRSSEEIYRAVGSKGDCLHDKENWR